MNVNLLRHKCTFEKWNDWVWIIAVNIDQICFCCGSLHLKRINSNSHDIQLHWIFTFIELLDNFFLSFVLLIFRNSIPFPLDCTDVNQCFFVSMTLHTPNKNVEKVKILNIVFVSDQVRVCSMPILIIRYDTLYTHIYTADNQ